MTSGPLTVDSLAEGVTRITLDRPERLNAMDVHLVQDLHDALGAVAADRSCRVVVLTGSGRAFCAGLDLGGYGTPAGAEGLSGPAAGFATQQLEVGSLQAGIDLENRTQILSSTTGDHREAVAAFLEKRPPVWPS
jgi:enoyl-CoA hydratase/carnithine racemase